MKKYWLAALFGLVGASGNAQETEGKMNLYSISISSLEGDKVDLKEFKGKKILFVNVASKCGFTSQYKGLQSLHKEYENKLVVVGVPCNQFGGQEPGSPEEIQSFCQKNYGVDFLMTEKIKVKGSDQHPLYQFLTKKENNGKQNATVRWNFHKFLVDEEGNLIKSFSSVTKPLSSELTGLL